MNIIAIILLLAILCALAYFVSRIARVSFLPPLLLALAFGLLFGGLSRELPAIKLPIDFFSTLALITFIILVFASTARLRLKTADTTAVNALSFVLLFASIALVAFAFVASYSLGLSVLSSIVLASLLLGISAEFAQSSRISQHVKELLWLEEYWTTPVAMLLPLLLAVFAPPLPMIFVSDIVNFLFFGAVKIMTSVAAGVFVGVLLTRVLKHTTPQTAPSAIIASAFIAFGLAYYFGGYGIFAVAVLGFFFANSFATFNKPFVDFSAEFAKYAGLLAVIMLGFVARTPVSIKFFATTIALFIVYLAIRYVAIKISHRKNAFSAKEELFLLLQAPNSAATCAILLFLTLFPPLTIPLSELYTVLTTGLMFVVYSNIAAFAFTKWKK